MNNSITAQLKKLYPVVEVKRAKGRPRHVGCNRYLEECVCEKATKAATTEPKRVQAKRSK